ncbi:DNA polymerase alpha-associated DNA helicase A [[Candida] anglica]
MGQVSLIEAFKNAIALEQKADSSLTEEYLKLYSPKKLSQLGLAVVNLVVSNLKTGLGGKTLIELQQDPATSSSPDEDIQPGTIRVGDIVKVSRMKASNVSNDTTTDSEAPIEAVVTRINTKTITVSVEEDTNDERILALYNNTGNDSTRMWIVKLTNSVTYKRMVSTMNKLEELIESGKSNQNQIISLLIGDTKYNKISSGTKIKDSEFFDPNLNESQKKAINFAVNESPITIIHGPPGTGKTYTLIELIKQLSFNKKEKVLVCGPSNISVDTILERLSSVFTNEDTTSGESTKSKRKSKKSTSNSGCSPEKLIRIGHPARLLPGNLAHSLDVLSKTNYAGASASTSDSKQILADIQKEISDAVYKVKKCKRYSERRALWTELKTLRKELRIREKKITEELLQGAQVILSTLHGAGSYELTSLYKNEALQFGPENPLFDTIIIDEVSQSLEPQCWIPMICHLGFKRLVIAGDNMQLPPTVKSKDESLGRFSLQEVADLELTLFDRLVLDHDGDLYKQLLDTQYRMNTKIMQFPSSELYENKLRAHESVANILLTDLPNVKGSSRTDDDDDIDDIATTCIWYDTQGGDYPEKSTDTDDSVADMTGSKYNELEALLCMQHLGKLLDSGVAPGDIGIISPYNAQVSLLKKSLHRERPEMAIADQVSGGKVEISTVDGFQGREKEAIIVSLVRSNDNREVGFLKDKRRLNVAITRPKRHLCVVGDLELMQVSGVKFLKNWAEFAEENFEIRYPQLGDY